MRGLLFKDFYMMIKYCRSILFFAAICLFSSFFYNEYQFMNFYPVLITSMLPVTLISYDEREKWNVYSRTLPYTIEQLVSSKYLVGLMLETIIFSLSISARLIHMLTSNVYDWNQFIMFALIIFLLGLIAPSFLLPFIFKFGAEKGRAAYLIAVVVLCIGATVISGSELRLPIYWNEAPILILSVIFGVAVYALSWKLSVRFFKNCEL